MADSDEDLKAAAPHAFTNVHYCAEGVKNDFQRVVDRFLSNQSVRYADFLQIWQEMHFYHIFRGRQTKPKLKEFAEECLALACELWIESTDFQVQVCGLYLLYGLYFCQPVEPKSSIRMTLPMWQAVQEFVVSVKEFQHCDVEYIFMKLLLAKAFHFVATVSNDNSVKDTDYRRKKMLSSEMLGEKQTPTMIQELLEPDNVLKLEVIDQQYMQMKRNLTGEQSTPDLSLSVIRTDLVEAITKDVTTFRARRLGAVNAPISEVSDASIQAQLKEKACLAKTTAQGRSRRRVMIQRSTKDEDVIDQAAMGAAVLSALRKPGYSGHKMSSVISMPSIWNAELIVDDKVESVRLKRKRSPPTGNKEDQNQRGKKSKSASEEPESSAKLEKSASKKTPKSTSKSKLQDEPSKSVKKAPPLMRKSPKKGTKATASIKIAPKKRLAKRGKT